MKSMKTKRLALALSMLLGFVMPGWGQFPVGESLTIYGSDCQDGCDGHTFGGEGTAGHTLTVKGGTHTITLDRMAASPGSIILEDDANVTLVVEGNNLISSGTPDKAAINVAPGATLTVTGGGTLIVDGGSGDGGGSGSAGIGGNATEASFGNIIIAMDEGGSLEAKGGSGAAGIGSGGISGIIWGEETVDITGSIRIKSGTIKARSMQYAASIGVGAGGSSEGGVTVIMEGGTVTCDENDDYGGIGRGASTTPMDIYVLGETVNGGIIKKNDITLDSPFKTVVVAPNAKVTGDVPPEDDYTNGFIFKDKQLATSKGDVVLPEGTTLEIPEGYVLDNQGTITGTITGDGLIIGNVPEGWEGNVAPPFVDGKFRISTPEHLKLFAAMVNDGTLVAAGLGMDAELMQDIDLSDSEWMPIGTTIIPIPARLTGRGMR